MLPETVCPSTIRDDLQNWVVKPALGRVGEGIGITGVTAEPKLQLIHKAAKRRPFEWVAQKRFTVIPVSNERDRYFPSIGIYTVDEKLAGVYGRVGRKALIDDEAQDIAVLITGPGGRG